MKKVFTFLYGRIFERVIKPILTSVSPVEEVALGMGIGVFIGLTPTVGIQMWIVFLIWLTFKYLMGIRFDVIIGTAVVWISNPFTMFFLYYGFFVTGVSFLSSMGVKMVEVSFQSFYETLNHIVNNPANSTLNIITQSTRFMFVDLGVPMLMGSLFFAVPLSIASYFATKTLLLKYRKYKAKQIGMDYETWRTNHERVKLKKKKQLLNNDF